jgi:hydroxyacylglutathione hydrolase
VLDVVTVDTPQLGNRSYLVHDGTHALVVDPPRDFQRLEHAAENAGVEVAAVAETHLHNDFVSGAPALARRHGVAHLVAAAERVSFRRRGVADGDVFEVGGLEVEVLATPGHTPGHVAYAARTRDAAAPVLFTGGSLLYGTVGRTDLSGAEQTERLTRAQYRSVRRLAERLPAETAVFPTHGFGSFCASSSACSASSGTIAAEAYDNAALTVDDEDRFVRDLLAGLGPVPAYYGHMAGLNRAGHGLEPVARPQLVGPDGLGAAVARGAWVVDLRGRKDFADAHLRGSVNVEYGTTCATYVGWVVPWGADIVLLANSEARLSEARRDLARIGIDRLAGATLGVQTASGQDVRSYPRRRWEDLLASYAGNGAPPEGIVLLDVRQRSEYDAGHLQGAVSVPVQDVVEAAEQIPPGTLWVHCRSGFRASVAASLLCAAGRRVVLVDDDWERVFDVGLAIEQGSEQGSAMAPAR